MTELETVKDLFSPFHPKDCLRRLAALQLDTRNADHLFRLEAASCAVAALPERDAPSPSNRRWRSLLNEGILHTQVARQEDPFVGPFAEEITFFGGSFVVLPGMGEDVTFILKCLLRCIFGHRLGNANYRRDIYDLVRGTLELSDLLTERAHIYRRTKAQDSAGGVHFLSKAELQVLESAVELPQSDFEDLLRDAGVPTSALDRLIMGAGEGTLPEDPNDSSLLRTPIVRFRESLIVTLPGGLLSALRNGIIATSIEIGIQAQVAGAFAEECFQISTHSLSLLKHKREELPVPSDPGLEGVYDALFRFDIDKVLYVQLMADSLDGYDPNRAFGRWVPPDNTSESLDERILQVESAVLSSGDVNEFMTLSLVQGLGRYWGLSIGHLPPVKSHRLAMSASDLETICLLEAPDPLALWNFARASHKLREDVDVMRFGILDEFQMYRLSGDGFYLSDDRKPDLISIVPEGGDLRSQVLDRFDFHGASSCNGSIEEVALLHQDAGVPIYFPWRALSPEIKLLVEAFPPLVWVEAEASSTLSLRRIHAHMADMVAYWLWQIGGDVTKSVNFDSLEIDCITVKIFVADPDQWTAKEVPTGKETPRVLPFRVHSPDLLILELPPTLIPLLASPRNEADRAIVRTLLRGLRELLGEAGNPLADELRDHILETRAPVGQKKKTFILPEGASPELHPTSVDWVPRISKAEVNFVLDDVGRELSSSYGNGEALSTTDLLNSAVSHLFEIIQKEVATLSPIGLLEWLVRNHEVIVNRRSTERFETPTRLACFSDIETMAEKLRQEIPETNETALASRFLIEYVAASPPKGLRPINLALHEKLLVACSTLIGWGVLSDLVYFDLDEPEVSILPSGRLGIKRSRFTAARDQFLVEHARAEIGRRTSNVERLWEGTNSNDPPPEFLEFEQATVAEFGFPIRTVTAVLGEVFNFGVKIDDEAKVVEREVLVETISTALDINPSATQALLDRFILGSRPNFLNPPSPYTPTDVYPWRFSRPLSYIQRPLISRVSNEETEQIVFGNRHLYQSLSNFISMVISGRFQPTTLALKQWVSRHKNESADAFTEEVSRLFDPTEWRVRTKIEMFGGKRLARDNGQALGDIDVLAGSPQRREILAIEAKDLAAARTAAEMKNEFDTLIRSTPSTMSLHGERTVWLRSNITEVITELGLPEGQYKVSPLLVVDLESVTAFLESPAIPIQTYQSLKRELIAKHA